jgi:hypothetical protein
MNDVSDALPSSLLVFTTDGRVQFGWLDPQTNALCSEADGRAIQDVAGSMPWAASQTH